MSSVHRFGVRALLGLCVLCATLAPGCVPGGLSGLWQGTLQLDGRESPLALAFFQRDSGEAYGYVLGGNDALRISAARQERDGSVTVRIERSQPGGLAEIELRGRIVGLRFRGRTSDGSSFSFVRSSDTTITERRLLIATLGTDGEPADIIDLGIARDAEGRLLAGSYAPRRGCGEFGCGGLVTSYEDTSTDERLPSVRLMLQHGGSCAGTGIVQLRFDPDSTLHTGSYETTDCTGSRAGAAIGTPRSRTSASHVLAALRAYASFAGLLETGMPLGGAVAPIAADYLHQSREARHLVEQINAQIARYGALQTAFGRFRNAHTLTDPFIYRELPTDFGIDFTDVRSGLEGAARVEIYRGDTQRGQDELKYLRAEGEGFLIVGNGIRHQLPYASYAAGDEHLEIATPGGTIYASVGTWGSHTPAHTGHIEGNAKADYMGFYARSRADLTELRGDGDGVCEEGETCGLAAARLMARAVTYTAPGDGFRIDSVIFERFSTPGFYFGGDQMWRVRGSLGPYSYDFGHLRGIAADLRNAMIAAGYTDPWSVDAPSDNLITGAPVVLDRGAGIAMPQIVAERLPEFPGFYGGYIWGSPWQQMEYSTFSNVSGAEESMYRWIAPEEESMLAGLLERDAMNPRSFRYGWVPASQRWLTYSEMALSNQDRHDSSDYSSIFSALGGWYENDRDCTTAERCDSIVAIFPISKNTRFYDASRYASANVSYLFQLGSRVPYELIRAGEVIEPVRPDPVAGRMLIAWRVGDTPADAEYQAVSYRLEEDNRLLRMAWGPIRGSAEEARSLAPGIPARGATCDGIALTCHAHDKP